MEAGLLQEIEDLLKQGVTFDDQCMQGIGYREFREYFEKDKLLEECIEEVKKDSRNFAKRQYTFFKNQLDVQWFDDQEKAMQAVKGWLQR